MFSSVSTTERAMSDLTWRYAPCCCDSVRSSGCSHSVMEAIRLANDLVESHDVPVRDGRGAMPEYVEACLFPTKARAQGWARRPPHGQQYGATYMKDYAKDIEELFGQGASESSAKMGPAQMHEALKQRYPDRFSLPAENEIRTEISKLFKAAKDKKAAGSTAAPTAAGSSSSSSSAALPRKRGRKSKIPPDVLDHISTLLQESPNAMPTDAVKSVRERFGQSIKASDGGPDVTDGQIKNRWNSLKTTKKPKYGLASSLATCNWLNRTLDTCQPMHIMPITGCRVRVLHTPNRAQTKVGRRQLSPKGALCALWGSNTAYNGSAPRFAVTSGRFSPTTSSQQLRHLKTNEDCP